MIASTFSFSPFSRAAFGTLPISLNPSDLQILILARLFANTRLNMEASYPNFGAMVKYALPMNFPIPSPLNLGFVMNPPLQIFYDHTVRIKVIRLSTAETKNISDETYMRTSPWEIRFYIKSPQHGGILAFSVTDNKTII